MKATQYITGAISKRQSRKNSANIFLLNFYQRGSHQLGCSVDAYLVPTACTDCGPSCWGAPAPLLRASPSKHPSLPSLLSSFTLVPSPLYQMNGGSICLFRMAHLFIGKHLHWSSDCSCSSLLSFSQPNCIVHLWLRQQTPFCNQTPLLLGGSCLTPACPYGCSCFTPLLSERCSLTMLGHTCAGCWSVFRFRFWPESYTSSLH